MCGAWRISSAPTPERANANSICDLRFVIFRDCVRITNRKSEIANPRNILEHENQITWSQPPQAAFLLPDLAAAGNENGGAGPRRKHDHGTRCGVSRRRHARQRYAGDLMARVYDCRQSCRRCGIHGRGHRSAGRDQPEKTTKKPPVAAMIKKSDFHVRDGLEVCDF